MSYSLQKLVHIADDNLLLTLVTVIGAPLVPLTQKERKNGKGLLIATKQTGKTCPDRDIREGP